jgi:hypothetical protein
MKTALKILLVPVIFCGLTAFGMAATVLSAKHPSPVPTIGAQYKAGGTVVSSTSQLETK